MSGQDESVAYTGVPTESGDTLALYCTDSLDLQKTCDPPSAIVPGDIIQTPRLVRGVATGSEESGQTVQAATSGWVVDRLGLLGAKVRRATRGLSGLATTLYSKTQRRRLRNAKQLGISRIPKLSLY